MIERFSFLIATVGGVGWLPKAPGTWGSLVGLVSAPFVSIWVACLICLLGWLCSYIIINRTKEADPSFIVIDEWVGMYIAVVMCARPMLWFDALGLFVAFRLFDIIKPFPIGWIDRVCARSSNSFVRAFGVMLDDIVAGVIAGLLWRTY